MKEVLTPDVCVIGAGPAGLAVAMSVATFGAPVVLIERGRIGGASLNSASIPAKALLAAASRAAAIRDAERFGLSAGPLRVNLAGLTGHAREVVAAIEPNVSIERLTGLGVTVLRGIGRFESPRSVRVEETEIRARRFVIATGSRPAAPPIPNLVTIPYLTNETVFGLKRVPGHLIVVGGGSRALELAQAFRRLGSEVTVLEAETALGGEDPELAALLLESLREEGIAIREGAKIARVTRRGRSGVRLTLEEPDGAAQIDGTHLLIATGRRADLDDLCLQKARVRFDADGVTVDSGLRTRNRRIYAIGDAAGGPHLASSAAHEGELVARAILFRFPARPRRDPLPAVTFTEPALARVGLSEAEAFRRHRRVRVLRWPYAENDCARAEGDTRGLVKVLATASGRIVGAHMLGHDAAELMAPFALAVARGLSVDDLARVAFPYPTRSEAARQAALTFYARRLDSPWRRKLAAMLRRFG